MKKEKTKMFSMRMDEQTRQKLESLASNETFKYNNSAVIVALINAEHVKHSKLDASM